MPGAKTNVGFDHAAVVPQLPLAVDDRQVEPDSLTGALAVPAVERRAGERHRGVQREGALPLDRVESLSDDEIIEGMKLLARTEGIFAETAGGVVTASLKRLAESGAIDPDETTVAFIKASIEGWIYARDNPEELARLDVDLPAVTIEGELYRQVVRLFV